MGDPVLWPKLVYMKEEFHCVLMYITLQDQAQWSVYKSYTITYQFLF